MKYYLLTIIVFILVGCNPSGGGTTVVDANPWEIAQVEGPLCGNGSEVNMAVNMAAKNAEEPTNKVVLYLQGGGACWDDVTCGVTGFEPSASYVDTNVSDNLVRYDANHTSMYGIGDRTDLSNPFRNDNFVYIPYCTGDVHSGSLSTVHPDTGILHRGGQNLLDFISQPNGVLDTFPDADEVFLVGASAGGFGTIAMYQAVSQAFGSVPVHLLSDGGIPLAADHQPAIDPTSVTTDDDNRTLAEFQIFLIETWGMSSFLPQSEGVTIDDFAAIFDSNTNVDLQKRHAVLTSLDDKVIQRFIHAGLLGPMYTILNFTSDPKYTVSDWRNAVNDADTYLSALPNAEMWIRNDSSHVYIGSSLLVEAGGVSLADWLSDFRNGSDTWATAKDEIAAE